MLRLSKTDFRPNWAHWLYDTNCCSQGPDIFREMEGKWVEIANEEYVRKERETHHTIWEDCDLIVGVTARK